MDEAARRNALAFTRSWCVVFLATVASGVLACWSLVAASYLVRLGGPAFNTSMPISRGVMMGAVLGAPVGAVSATVCAPFLMRRPRRTVFWSIVLVSLIIGPLTSPIFHIFSAGLVLIAQVLTSVIIFSTGETDRVSGLEESCLDCGYSLEGLDRAKASVCPECGAALPVLHA